MKTAIDCTSWSEVVDRLPFEGTNTEWMRGRILQRAGIQRPSLEAVRRVQWCPSFVARVQNLVTGDVVQGDRWRLFRELMHNRMVVGFYRYQLSVRDPDQPRFDNIGSARERLWKYARDGNTEHLVDAANLCMIEAIKAPFGRGTRTDARWGSSSVLTSARGLAQANSALSWYVGELEGNLWRVAEAAASCAVEFHVAPWGGGFHPSPSWQPAGDGAPHAPVVG